MFFTQPKQHNNTLYSYDKVRQILAKIISLYLLEKKLFSLVSCRKYLSGGNALISGAKKTRPEPWI